ncbi:UDP-Gal or UDP-GlcNAc-dependent glycosyltransferase [Trypanosoma grayi]|uniref:UDP-Gal or UDP-GlcNAc-dependent glycosyltransferase n=1 Tax=Trypanosoma grayi TaxID=71804 RepID=UPI0004F473A4|nr:UDP-Gal or UDP-GlcNAc-dependent glycosyltransferase [Trypanosoma grayi]KEG07439.1 UDP-Gal or UDP-GlcNAc-dependent glycosyltransferase [Trypanosoma grayi]
MWYHVALYLFPQANYIAKGDDDMFLRVPQYLADLRTLPRRGVYWGFFDISRRMKVRYATGYSVTLARDVAEQVVSYEPIRNLVYRPHKANESDFLNMNMEHEDVMVGRAIKERRYPHLVYAREKSCRFHDVHVGLSVQPVTSRSVAIHHIKESEYAELMERFGNDTP